MSYRSRPHQQPDFNPNSAKFWARNIMLTNPEDRAEDGLPELDWWELGEKEQRDVIDNYVLTISTMTFKADVWQNVLKSFDLLDSRSRQALVKELTCLTVVKMHDQVKAAIAELQLLG
jgi:hypothetical protein